MLSLITKRVSMHSKMHGIAGKPGAPALVAQRFCANRFLRSAEPVEPTSGAARPQQLAAKRTGLSPDTWRKDTGRSRPRSKSSVVAALAAEYECRTRIGIGAQRLRHIGGQPVEAAPHVHGLASQIDLHARCELEHQRRPAPTERDGAPRRLRQRRAIPLRRSAS